MVSKNLRILYLCILVFLLIVIFFYRKPITSMVTQFLVSSTATVASEPVGEIKYLLYSPETITAEEQVSIIVNSTNIGNSLGDFRVRLIISKVNQTLFNSSCDFSMDVGQEETCIFYYTPTQAGTYQLQADLKNQTETELWDTKLKNMTVSAKAVSPPGGPSGGPSRPAGPSPAPIVKSIEIIDYPPALEGIRGGIKMVPIDVKNTGNTDLDNVSLIVEDLPFFTKISPDSLELSQNTTKTFLVRIEIPETAESGDYRFNVKAVADNVSDTKTITLKVIFKPVEDRIRLEIIELRDLIEKFWRNALDLQIEGFDVTHIFQILDEARENLRSAEEYYEIGDYETSEEHLEIVRTHLEEAAVEISKFKTRLIVLPAFTFQQQIIIAILGIVIAVLIVVIMIQRKKIITIQEEIWSKLKEKWKTSTEGRHLYRHYITQKRIEKLKKKEESKE